MMGQSARTALWTVMLLSAVMVLAVSCTCGRTAEKPMAQSVRHFPMVQPPAVMEGQASKLSYISAHFWDSYLSSVKGPYGDTTLVGGVPRVEVEQAVSNYSVLLCQLPLDEARADMSAFVGKISACEKADTASNVFEVLSDMVQRYFYDPNSPFRDEDIYHAFAAEMAGNSLVGEVKRSAFADEARRTALNSRGTRAADFSFSDRNGRTYSLYGIKADYVILFFSNPGCTACKEIIEALSSSPAVNSHIDDGTLAVLNIYIDEELDKWYEYMPIYPDKWYNGYDHNYLIRGDELYDVRAIPSLYFLDKSKTVLLKDAPLEKLISNLPWQ